VEFSKRFGNTEKTSINWALILVWGKLFGRRVWRWVENLLLFKSSLKGIFSRDFRGLFFSINPFQHTNTVVGFICFFKSLFSCQTVWFLCLGVVSSEIKWYVTCQSINLTFQHTNSWFFCFFKSLFSCQTVWFLYLGVVSSEIKWYVTLS
jgi:hypothetical protein